MGQLDDRARLLRMVGGNLALLEAQAICLSTLASAVAVVLGYIARGGSWSDTLFDALFLTASATCTAAVATFVLGACASLGTHLRQHALARHAHACTHSVLFAVRAYCEFEVFDVALIITSRVNHQIFCAA